MFETFKEVNSRDDIMREPRTESRGISTASLAEESSKSVIVQSKSLSSAQLRAFADKSSSVRPAIDGITREISNMPYIVHPRDPDKPVTSQVARRIEIVMDLFNRPNANPLPFSQLLSTCIDDLLTLDRMTMEVVKNRLKTKVVELWDRDAATIRPTISESGIWTHFVQTVPTKANQQRRDPIIFPPDRMIYITMFARTNNALGRPIIETIINEVVSLIYAIQSIGIQFTEDEIPPGVLWLGEGMSREIWDRVRSSLMQSKKRAFKENKLRVYGGGTVPPKWVELKHTNREVQMRELRKDIEDIVWLNFGILPSRMGRTGTVNKSNIEQQARWQESNLLTPILNLLGAAVTKIIIQDGFGFKDLVWRISPDREENRTDNAVIAERLTHAGIFSINGIRKSIYNEEGFNVPAADLPMIMTNSGPIFLEDLKPGQSNQPADIGDDSDDDDPDDSDSGDDESPEPDDDGGDATSETPTAESEIKITDGHMMIPEMAEVDKIFTDGNHIGAGPEMIKQLMNWPETIENLKVYRVRRDRREFDVRPFETLAESYAAVMRVGWYEARDRIESSIKGTAVERSVTVDPDRTERVRQGIGLILAGLIAQYDHAAGQALALAAEMGILEAAALNELASLPPGIIREVVKNRQMMNTQYLRGNLFKDVLNHLRKVMRQEFKDLTALGKAAALAFNVNEYRIIRYARYVIPVGGEAWVKALDVTQKYSYTWELGGSDNICSACIRANAGSPYLRYRDLPFMPGNSPVCNGNCRCSMRAEVRS